MRKIALILKSVQMGCYSKETTAQEADKTQNYEANSYAIGTALLNAIRKMKEIA